MEGQGCYSAGPPEGEGHVEESREQAAESFLKRGLPGRVFWITGLSGSGKSTLGSALYGALRDLGRPVVFVDGDAVRAACSNDLGYTQPDRLQNAYRMARLCLMFSLQGLDVVCSTVSLFGEIHAWNRLNQARYREVHLDVSPEVLRARNQKGLYAEAERGDQLLPGVNQSFDAPQDPDLRVEGRLGDLAGLVNRILELPDRA